MHGYSGYASSKTEYPFSLLLDTALIDCDAVILMTKHDEYKSITPAKLQGLLRRKVIVDGRNMFDPAAFVKEGGILKGVGKGNINK